MNSAAASTIYGFARGIEFFQIAAIDVEQVAEFVVHGRFVQRQYPEGGAAVGDLVAQGNIQVAGEEEIFPGRRELIPHDLAQQLQMFQGQRDTREERDGRFAGLGDDHHLIEADLRRAGLVADLLGELQGDLARNPNSDWFRP